MKFVGVREFKQDGVKYLNQGSEIVVTKRKKPIAQLVPVRERTAEMVLLEIGRVLDDGDRDLLSIPREALNENGIPCRILTPQEFAERV